MTICFFGNPNKFFSRNKILIDGLRQNKVKVIFCTDSSGFAFIRYWRLAIKFVRVRKKIDSIFVQFPGHLNMPIAWILGKIYKKPIVFDVFISLYDTYIFDRKIAKPKSLKAYFYWWIDKISCSLADIISLDTHSHIRFFKNTFNLNHKEFSRIPIGSDDSTFHPLPVTKISKPHDHKTIVEFHGMFTRMHGAEHFVKAAKQLENHKQVEFWLIGDSKNYRAPINLCKKLKPKTLKYWPRLYEKKLAKKIARADITVGHLGTTGKARRVISFKIMHGLACKNTVIAPNTKTICNNFKNRVHCLLVKPGNSQDLAKKILYLAKHKQLQRQLSKNGYNFHKKHFSNIKIGKSLKQLFESILQ